MDIVFECCHCKLLFIINENDLNCCIIRHASYKEDTTKPVNCHLSKVECDKLVENDLVVGCCKPLKIIKNDDNTYSAIECDYI
jgi:hypothetical protein